MSIVREHLTSNRRAKQLADVALTLASDYPSPDDLSARQSQECCDALFAAMDNTLDSEAVLGARVRLTKAQRPFRGVLAQFEDAGRLLSAVLLGHPGLCRDGDCQHGDYTGWTTDYCSKNWRRWQ